MSIRVFDLNIEEVLENWDVEHAIREVIANALDEQILSATGDIQIQKDAKAHFFSNEPAFLSHTRTCCGRISVRSFVR